MSDQLDQFLNEQLAKNKAVDRALDRINSFETRGTFFGIHGTDSKVGCVSGTIYDLYLNQDWDFAPGDWPGGMLVPNLGLAGTTSVTIGSTAVTGVGTAYLAELYKGACLYCGGVAGVIESVQSNTVATLMLTSLVTTVAGVSTRWTPCIGIPTPGVWLCEIQITATAVATLGYVFVYFNFPRLGAYPAWVTRIAAQSAAPTFTYIQYLLRGDIFRPQVAHSNSGATVANMDVHAWITKLS